MIFLIFNGLIVRRKNTGVVGRRVVFVGGCSAVSKVEAVLDMPSWVMHAPVMYHVVYSNDHLSCFGRCGKLRKGCF